MAFAAADQQRCARSGYWQDVAEYQRDNWDRSKSADRYAEGNRMRKANHPPFTGVVCHRSSKAPHVEI